MLGLTPGPGARGAAPFQTDLQFKSCVALARLVPALFGPATPAEDVLFDQEHWTPQRLAQLKKFLEQRKQRTREDCAESWAEDFRSHGPSGERFSTEEEAREYGRQLFDHSRAAEVRSQRQALQRERAEARKRMNRRRRI